MTDIENLPEFLKVKSGDTVLPREDEIAKFIAFIGGLRDPDFPIIFPTANLQTGAINWLQAGEVKDIVIARENG